MFALVYLNIDDAKRYTAQRYLPKLIIENYNVIINGKNFCDHPHEFHIKPYKELRKLTPRKGEDYIIGWLLSYEYIKNHYRLKAVDLSRQKELDANPKAT